MFENIIEEVLQEKRVSSRGKRRERAVKRKMKGWTIKKGIKLPDVNFVKSIEIIK